VDFIEDEKRGIGKLPTKDSFPVLGNVPAQVSLTSDRKAFDQGGLADLSCAGNENHFPTQIMLNLGGQVSLYHQQRVTTIS
jgi:hypothetical protein